MIRRRLLSRLGRHVFDLLHRPPKEWGLLPGAMRHSSGLALSMVPGQFDVADAGLSDFITELSWLDRLLLWPLALRVRHQLKFPELHSNAE